jgi:hypothetical protein
VSYANGVFSFGTGDQDVTFDIVYTMCRKQSPFHISFVEYTAATDRYECVYLHSGGDERLHTGNQRQAELFQFCHEDGKIYIKKVRDDAKSEYVCMSPDEPFLAVRNIDGHYMKCEVIPL